MLTKGVYIYKERGKERKRERTHWIYRSNSIDNPSNGKKKRNVSHILTYQWMVNINELMIK